MTTANRRRFALDGAVTVIACAVAAVLLWQGAEYVGLVARAAEWQFGAADRYWPTLTVALAVLLGLALVLLILALRRRRRDADAIAPAEHYRRALAGETRLLRLSAVLALIGVVGALVCYTTAERLSDAGPVRTIDASSGAAPVEGPALVIGRVDMTRIAVLTRTVLFARQQLFFAPIVDREGRARYLVELTRVETPRERWHAPRQGLLRRFPAARELAPLYQGAGVILDDRPYALLRSADTLRWTWYAAAAQCAAFGLVAGLFALLFRRRRRRLAALAPDADAATPG